MIGITIASSEFEELAVKACKRFRQHTGIKKTIIVSTENEKNYAEKLKIYELLQRGETMAYFDADLWFIRDADLSVFENRREFIACWDPGCKPEYSENHFPYRDAVTFGIPAEKYFNGGFFVFNERHIKAFKLADKLMRSVSKRSGKKMIDGKPLFDFGEQSTLNYAMIKTGTPVEIISSRYNFMPFACQHVAAERVSAPFTVHAAGYGWDAKFPDETAGAMKIRALHGMEYQYKSDRGDIDFYGV